MSNNEQNNKTRKIAMIALFFVTFSIVGNAMEELPTNYISDNIIYKWFMSQFSLKPANMVVNTIESGKAVFVPAKGNGAGTFQNYTGATCTSMGGTSPCARYDEGTLRVDMDRHSVKYQVQNSQGQWRYIRYDVLNPTNLIPVKVNSPKSLLWTNMYPNNTSLRYVLEPHGIKLDIWGKEIPPSDYFNFTTTISANTTYRMQGDEILFFDTYTNEQLWIIKHPSMNVNGTNVPLELNISGSKVSIYAPDMYSGKYNFSEGWELDPSTQSGSTIYINDRQNLSQVYTDIVNDTALSYDGSGNCLLNANLYNNKTTNVFYRNRSDTYCYNSLRINSTNISSSSLVYYYVKNDGIMQTDNYLVTSWNTTTSTPEAKASTATARSYEYSTSGSHHNISNSNFSYLGSSLSTSTYGVSYTSSLNNVIVNSTFYKNFVGILLTTSSDNTLTNNTVYSNSGRGIYLSSSSNNTLTNNTANSNSYGIYLSTSSNNTITNTNVFSSTTYDYYLLSSYINNKINNSNFTSSRKIYFNDNTSIFEYDHNAGIWLKTQLIIIPTTTKSTTRSLSNWTQVNVTWTETLSSAGQFQYNITGLAANTQYNVFNDSVLNYTNTTDASGTLTPFTINFTTSAKTISIVQNTTNPRKVSGYALDINGLGISSAFISLNSTMNTSSDANGYYQFLNVSNGTYNIQALLQGKINQTITINYIGD